MTEVDLLEARTRRQWRRWLAAHHDREPGVWLVFSRRHTGVTSLSYDEAVEEAICFGWIDSLVKRLDDERYARKFTPRKPESRWSTANRRRYADLAARGLLMAPGLERPPTGRSGDAPRPPIGHLPPYIEKALRADCRAWDFFQRLAPSYRRNAIAWIDSAKRQQTRQRRLQEVVALVAAGRKPGLR